MGNKQKKERLNLMNISQLIRKIKQGIDLNNPDCFGNLDRLSKVEKVMRIEQLGVRMLSFSYKGKKRNAAFGASIVNAYAKRNLGIPDNSKVWFIPIEGSRTLVTHKESGQVYCRLLVNNDTSLIKVFAIERMSDIKGI